MGIVLQKKEDRWRKLEDRGNSREWEERRETVERELTSAGRRASNWGGPRPFLSFHNKSKQFSQQRQASVGSPTADRVAEGGSEKTREIALANCSCTRSRRRKLRWLAPHHTALQYSSLET